MFTHKKLPKGKFSAQSMVEFALVLPILLTLLYGILEAGRLLFIFASVNTASRQAVRYGSAIGMVDTDDDGAIDTPRYEDCVGMTSVANNVAFLAPFTNINITYDRGLDTSGNVVPITGINPNPATGDACGSLIAGTIQNGDRVNVYVSAQFSPIIQFIPLGPINIQSSASRTIIGEISIQVTARPGSWPGAGGESDAIMLTIVEEETEFYNPGDKMNFRYVIFNPGTNKLLPPYTITITSTNAGAVTNNCASLTSQLPSGGSLICSGSYTIAQEDMNNGDVTITAEVTSGNGITSPDPDAEIYFFTNNQKKILSLELLNPRPPTEAFTAGVSFDLFFRISNTGNVTLKGPFNIIDPVLGTFECFASDMNMGDQADCYATHTVTDIPDIQNGVIEFLPYARAEGSGLPSNVLDAIVVVTKPFVLDNIVASYKVPLASGEYPAPDRVVMFTYTLRNAGGSEISGITGPNNIAVGNGVNVDPFLTCTGISLVNKGDTMTCQSEYTLTQADLNAGFIRTKATFSGVINNEAVTSSVKTSNDLLIPQNVVFTFSVSTNPAPDANGVVIAGVNQLITYTYTFTNTGNVTLKNFNISDKDNRGNMYTLTCPDPADPNDLVEPGDPSISCTRDYTVTQTDVDIDGNIVTNSLQATASYGTSSVSSAINAATPLPIIITYNNPRIDLLATVVPSATEYNKGKINFTIRNTGNVALSNVSTPTTYANVNGINVKSGDPACSIQVTLPIGASYSCNSEYGLTQTVLAHWTVTGTTPASLSVSDTDPVPDIKMTHIDCNQVYTSKVISNGTNTPKTWIVTNNSGTAMTINLFTVNWTTGNTLNSITGTNVSAPPINILSTPVTGPANGLYSGNWTLPSGATTFSFAFQNTMQGADISALTLVLNECNNKTLSGK